MGPREDPCQPALAWGLPAGAGGQGQALEGPRGPTQPSGLGLQAASPSTPVLLLQPIAGHPRLCRGSLSHIPAPSCSPGPALHPSFTAGTPPLNSHCGRTAPPAPHSQDGVSVLTSHGAVLGDRSLKRRVRVMKPRGWALISWDGALRRGDETDTRGTALWDAGGRWPSTRPGEEPA